MVLRPGLHRPSLRHSRHVEPGVRGGEGAAELRDQLLERVGLVVGRERPAELSHGRVAHLMHERPAEALGRLELPAQRHGDCVLRGGVEGVVAPRLPHGAPRRRDEVVGDPPGLRPRVRRMRHREWRDALNLARVEDPGSSSPQELLSADVPLGDLPRRDELECPLDRHDRLPPRAHDAHVPAPELHRCLRPLAAPHVPARLARLVVRDPPGIIESAACGRGGEGEPVDAPVSRAGRGVPR